MKTRNEGNIMVG